MVGVWDYDKESVDFINERGIAYAIECYESQGLCTICEDGEPKSWSWEDGRV